MQGLDPLIFIADPGSRIRILLFYRGSGIPDPDPFVFIADPGSRSFYFIADPGSGSSYFIADPDPLIFMRIRDPFFFIADPEEH
jgi:hypothetical protein